MAESPDVHPHSPPAQLSDAPIFERTLGRLEEIVHLLEEGQIGLDQALSRYEEGVGLLHKAYELLDKAQRQILLLSGIDAEGNPILRPIEDTASFSLERETGGPFSPSVPSETVRGRRTRRPAKEDSPEA
jgi:exodeoxyribonuclease VII small subunit